MGRNPKEEEDPTHSPIGTAFEDCLELTTVAACGSTVFRDLGATEEELVQRC